MRTFPKGFELKPSHIIKMGKMEYKIEEINNGKISYDQ